LIYLSVVSRIETTLQNRRLSMLRFRSAPLTALAMAAGMTLLATPALAQDAPIIGLIVKTETTPR
jgi:ABC-type sugar transport system substrate-binding protein